MRCETVTIPDNFGSLDSNLLADIHNEIIDLLALEITNKTNFFDLCKSNINCSKAGQIEEE
jgi:hypothetical protein